MVGVLRGPPVRAAVLCRAEEVREEVRDTHQLVRDTHHLASYEGEIDYQYLKGDITVRLVCTGVDFPGLGVASVRREVMAYSEDLIQKVWEKARAMPDHDPTEWRQDECGAWLRRQAYRHEKSEHGWTIVNTSPVHARRRTTSLKSGRLRRTRTTRSRTRYGFDTAPLNRLRAVRKAVSGMTDSAFIDREQVMQSPGIESFFTNARIRRESLRIVRVRICDSFAFSAFLCAPGILASI